LEAARAAAGRGESRPRAHRADLVVLATLLGVAEHAVRLADLLELGLGLGIALIGIGVILAGELAVRLLQLRIGDVLRDAERLVEVLVEPVLTSHRSPAYSAGTATTTFAGRSSTSPSR